MLIGTAKDLNGVVDALAGAKTWSAVEYHRGKDLRGCKCAGELWDMALWGKVLLAQKRYGESDYGYWAIKPQIEKPLPVAFRSFGLDFRGRDQSKRTGKHY